MSEKLYQFDYLVIGGGETPRTGFLKRLASRCKNVVTVDRGALAALRMGAQVALHVGDDDSFKFRRSSFRPKARIHLSKTKSISDFEYALEVLPANSKIVAVGCHRDHEFRTDHAFINLLILSRFPRLTLADEKMWIQKIKTPKSLYRLKKGTPFSVVPLKSERVSIEGATFSINDKAFTNPSLGLSNMGRGGIVSVKFHGKIRGPALIFVGENILTSKLP